MICNLSGIQRIYTQRKDHNKNGYCRRAKYAIAPIQTLYKIGFAFKEDNY